ncbi:mitochondrial import inner membrane translocase subunit TIM44-like isoform X2 [Mya arenaria]|uniref:mitochondrial import inner membrane translocase subunit TIM44-like isoform X2 n=1 Tax=Mya arenaria TaxID=6604 RepID=UPI0022DFCB95|nr:mitochondrial import inner membrane translocase subunit TIM44-like isoform X2 [Mya arenaria]
MASRYCKGLLGTQSKACQNVLPTSHCLSHEQTSSHQVVVSQSRHYSDGRKGFFKSIYDNVKEGLEKDTSLNENLKKFRDEKKKLETSDAIKEARKKFEKIEAETSKGSDTLKKGFEDVKEKLSETYEEVSKSEYMKKGKEITSEFTKTAGKAGEVLREHGKRIGDSTPLKTMSQGVKVVRDEIDDTLPKSDRPYRAPDKLWMRTEKVDGDTAKIYEPDNETIGIALHKDSRWKNSWTSFKENNEIVNKIFDLKTKYDESDNVVVRGTKFFTEKITSVFGGMFSSTEMSEVLTEINKMDPTFDKDEFVQWCQYFVIPNLLESLCRGEEEILKDWCYEAPYNVLVHPITQAKAQGLKLDSHILDISGVDVAAGKIMEQGPVLVITFIAQQIIVVRDSKGKVVEGDPNKVMRTNYVWALCRDPEELNPRAAWRLLDISASSQEQFF